VVLAVQSRLHLGGEDLLVEDVRDPYADPVDLVGVRRADATPGRADLVLPEEPLADLVDRGVVRRDQVGARADQQPAGVHPAGLEAVDLGEQHPGVHHHAVGDDRGAPGGQHAARQQVGGELLTVDDDGVARVVAALVADAVVDRSGTVRTEHVGGLALALVTPLGAEHHDGGH
jgi:hypothetical protein